MQLTPREKDKLLISMAAEVARKRLARGVKLNHPEAIALITDAWHPQINGVVRTWSIVVEELARAGHAVATITPGDFRGLPCPGEPDIRLALATPAAIGERLTAIAPEAIHIATEGPLGTAARAWCRAQGLAFTTSYHTHFPQYLKMRLGVPKRLTYGVIRRFHKAAARVMVTTPTLPPYSSTATAKWSYSRAIPTKNCAEPSSPNSAIRSSPEYG